MAERHAKSRIFNAVVFTIGAIALSILLYRMGVDGVRRALGSIGWWFAVVAALDLASVLCDAFAVYSFLRRQAPDARYLRVFAAQASGLAINRLTPANSLGEPTKVTMLVQHVPQEAAVSAIVMFNLTTIFVGIAAIVIGVPVTVLLLDLPGRVEIAVWIATGVLVALAVVLAVIVKRGAVGTLLDLAARLRIVSAPRAVAWRARATLMDAEIRRVAKVRGGVAGVLGSRVFNWAGTIALLFAADVSVTAPLVIAMLSVGILVTWMSNIVPLGLGLADTGNYALYGALGAGGAAGLDFTMVNRMRTIVLAAMGLTVMAIAQAVRARSPRPPQDH